MPIPTTRAPIGVFYEHPQWFEPMFAEFDRRGLAYDRVLAHEHRFDPAESSSPYSLLLNRMSPSAFTRGHGHAIPYTLQYLDHLASIGANVLGDAHAYAYEFSKARQLGLLARLGVRHPRAIVINHGSQAAAASEGLRFPVVVKPNIGGSGAGIQRFDTVRALRYAGPDLDLGLDHTALVQEYLAPRDTSVIRVEVLDGRYLYAIRLRLESPNSFNLCPADYCRVDERPTAGTTAAGTISLDAASGTTAAGTTAAGTIAAGTIAADAAAGARETPFGGGAAGGTGAAITPFAPPPIERFDPPRHVIDTVLRITREAHIEVGGVEYLVNDADGETYFYDINALSNFVANAPDIVGFDPFPRLVDFIEARARTRAVAA